MARVVAYATNGVLLDQSGDGSNAALTPPWIVGCTGAFDIAIDTPSFEVASLVVPGVAHIDFSTDGGNTWGGEGVGFTLTSVTNTKQRVDCRALSASASALMLSLPQTGIVATSNMGNGTDAGVADDDGTALAASIILGTGSDASVAAETGTIEIAYLIAVGVGTDAGVSGDTGMLVVSIGTGTDAGVADDDGTALGLVGYTAVGTGTDAGVAGDTGTDLAVGGGATTYTETRYFRTDTDSGGGGYRKLGTSAGTANTNVFITAGSSGDIDPEGNVYQYYQAYLLKRTAGGTETVLATGAIVGNNGSTTETAVSLVLGSPVSMSGTDRLLIEVRSGFGDDTHQVFDGEGMKFVTEALGASEIPAHTMTFYLQAINTDGLGIGGSSGNYDCRVTNFKWTG